MAGTSCIVSASTHATVTGIHAPVATARRPTDAVPESTGSLNVMRTVAFGGTLDAPAGGDAEAMVGGVASIPNVTVAFASPPWLSITRTRRVAFATSTAGTVHEREPEGASGPPMSSKGPPSEYSR